MIFTNSFLLSIYYIYIYILQIKKNEYLKKVELKRQSSIEKQAKKAAAAQKKR
jgi:hypothetical protein